MTEIVDSLEVWDRTQATQRGLYESTLRRVKALETTVDDLKQELSAYKSAFSASSKEAEEHAKIVTSLRQSLADSTNHNGCSVAVIDGDGYPFAPEFLRGGRGGGQKAATALKAKLVAATSPDEQILIFVYLNRLGMTDHLLANNLLKRAHDFDDFIRGFNQASPLFHVIDVGHGKEAADAKIRDLCRYFARAPQTRRVFFAGGHDGGYATFLRSLRTDGISDKIVMLRSDLPFARDIKALGYEEVDCSDVFVDLDAFVNSGFTPKLRQSVAPIPTQSEPYFPVAAAVAVSSLASLLKHQLTPPPENLCFDFYFAEGGCPPKEYPQTCRFVHDMTFSQEHIKYLLQRPDLLEVIRSFRPDSANSVPIQDPLPVVAPPAYPALPASLTGSDYGLNSRYSGVSGLSLSASAPTFTPQASAMPSTARSSNVVSRPPIPASGSSKSRARLDPATRAKFGLLIEMLKERIRFGESMVQWSQVGQYLRDRDKSYLAKAGFESMKLYIRRAKELGVISIKENSDDNNLSTVSLKSQWR